MGFIKKHYIIIDFISVHLWELRIILKTVSKTSFSIGKVIKKIIVSYIFDHYILHHKNTLHLHCFYGNSTKY